MADHYSDNQRELFKQLASGAEAALEIIVQLNEKTIRKAIQQIVQQQELSEEVWLDTIQTLWEHRAEMVAINNPLGWLLVTARNKAINKIRDEKRRASYPLHLLEEPAGTVDIELDMEIKEYRQLIEKALAKLSPREQEVYTLMIKNGLNRKETAEQLNISEHTVKNQLRNAMLSLRKHLRKLMSSILI